jgi:hypothetical protein
MIRAAGYCADCGLNLMPDTPNGSHDWQRYMVHDRVWSAAGLRLNDGWMCVDCLEQRLSRPLTGADFEHLEMNRPGRDDDTPRLAELKATAWQRCDDSNCVACIRYYPDRLKAFRQRLDDERGPGGGVNELPMPPATPPTVARTHT